jgi:hypothetical protein
MLSFSSLVHSLRDVLASGSACAIPLPDFLAAAPALSPRWHRGTRCA